MANQAHLPVAGFEEIRRYLRRIYGGHSRALRHTLLWYVLAAVAGLCVPPLLGRLVEAVLQDGRAAHSAVSAEAVALLAATLLVAEAALARKARLSSRSLGEQVLADLRESFVQRVLALPLAVVERAGAGDLLTRTTRDIDALSRNIRFALPEMVTALLSMTLTCLGVLLVNPVLFLPCLVSLPVFYAASRWYLRRAPAGYLKESHTHSELNEAIAETVGGAKTVEALRRAEHRIARTDADIGKVFEAALHTLNLRSVWLPSVGMGYFLPLPTMLLVGGLLYSRGSASIAEVTTATLYAQQLGEPVTRLSHYLNDLLVGSTALARLLGIPAAQPRPAGMLASPDAAITAHAVRYSYGAGHDVLHGIDLDVRPGEHLALIGPSGAGKSTLGRILVGEYAPTSGTVTLGGTRIDSLSPDGLRRLVSLVPQEHYVFAGTVRDNVALPRPDATDADVRAALCAVHAGEWVEALPSGLSTPVGALGLPFSPAQAQQLAMARLVLAAPAVLVLDEATSLIDLREARTLEQSLAAAVAGRTVIAIAHRLHTARDADRIAVMENGALIELGSHEELVGRGGAYARLWKSWHPDSALVDGQPWDDTASTGP